jgi:hydroxyacylglutathione hydrolase
MLSIHTLAALKDNFVYVLVDDAKKTAAVIDPGEAPPVEAFLLREKLKLTDILCTHHHLDHIGGVAALKAHHHCEVVCSDSDRPRIAPATTSVHEGEPFRLWEHVLTILAMPGHTLGQIAYYLPDEKAIFVGDTLFSAGCGRLFEGTPEQMFNSLAKLKALPPATKIYFGHEYTLNNLDFVLAHEPKIEAVRQYREEVAANLAAGDFSTPTTLARELKVNPFLWSPDIVSFTRWREARNQW